MSDETYEGWANRETWAFWLHVTNDQGWCNSVREFVQEAPSYRVHGDMPDDYTLGTHVVDYVQETLHELMGTSGLSGRDFDPNDSVWMMLTEIGSWWRIDNAEIGAAARELASDQ